MTDTGSAHQVRYSQDGVRHTLEIVVPPEAMAERVERVATAYRGRIRLPGFRKGKAPLNMVRQQFGGEIRQRVLDQAIPEYVSRELEARNLEPLASPQLSDVDYSPGGALGFTVQFDTAPEVVVGETEFAARRRKVDVTEEIIDAALGDLRERAARLVPVEDGVVESGTYARCQISLLPKDGKGKRLAEEDRFVHVGNEKAIPGLNDQIDGLGVGEQREFITRLADGYPNAILAGKEVLCRVTVQELKRRHLPDLDDDLAKEFAFDDLQALRAHTAENLAEHLEREADRDVERQLLEQLRANNPVQVPSTLIEQRIDEIARRFAVDLDDRSIDVRNAVDWNAFRAEHQTRAEQLIADELLLDRLADDNGLKVDDEAVQGEIRRQAESREGGNARTMMSLTQQMRKDGSFEGLRRTMRRRLALDHLRARATIEIEGGEQITSDSGDFN